METNLVVKHLIVYLGILRVHGWVQVSLLPYPPVAVRKLLLFLIILIKRDPEEVFKVTGEPSVFQESLFLPVHFCKRLLAWLIDVSLGSGLQTG